MQRRVLGKAGYEAYRAGAVTLDDFVGARRSREWGTTLRARSLAQILGEDEAGRWGLAANERAQRDRIARQIVSLGERQVLSLGDIPADITRHWASSTGNQEVVLTGNRRIHYLQRHPEMAEYESLLSDVVLRPSEVHKNRYDDAMAIFYYRLRDLEGHYLRATVLMQKEASRLRHSIISFRLAKSDEIARATRQGRRVWRQTGG